MEKLKRYEETVKVEIKGAKPYLMHKFSAGTGTARKKIEYIPEEEAEKNANRSADGKLVIPSRQIEGALIKAAVNFKLQGKKTYKDAVKAGIEVIPMEIETTPQKYKINETPVVISRARVLAWRPQLDDWKASFKIKITDDRIAKASLKAILTEAGRYCGIGDWRPKFGLFEITKFE